MTAKQLLDALATLADAPAERLEEVLTWVSATEPQTLDRATASLRYLAGGPAPDHLLLDEGGWP